ncbi:MAG: nuclear transport factor 2 family protein [Actinomycetota bacterium]|nr:nuclear transport factor 2 family protein [Actinomycetota bacterium]
MSGPASTGVDGAEQAGAETANAEFYAAFEAADLDRMAAVWAEDPVTCVHPGWAALRGRNHVLRSWAVIMANTSYIQFFLTDVETTVEGDIAVLTCTENILTGGEDGQGSLESARVMATNVFRRRGEDWRLFVHHGSPVIAPRTSAADGAPG